MTGDSVLNTHSTNLRPVLDSRSDHLQNVPQPIQLDTDLRQIVNVVIDTVNDLLRVLDGLFDGENSVVQNAHGSSLPVAEPTTIDSSPATVGEAVAPVPVELPDAPGTGAVP